MSIDRQEVAERIRRTRIGVISHLTPAESLTSDGILDELREAADYCIENREIQVIVELSRVQVLNSRALETLLDIQDKLVPLGGWLKLAHASPIINEIFQITRFTEFVSVIDGESGAGPLHSTHPDLSSRKRLGDILVERGLITEAQVQEALALQQKHGKRLGQIVVESGWISDRDLLPALSEHLSIPYVRLRTGLYDPDVITMLDNTVARRLKVLPLFKIRDVVSLATANPQAMPELSEVAERLGCKVKPVLARQEGILKIINENLGGEYTEELLSDVDDDFEVVESILPDDYSAIDDMAAGSPVINLVNSIIQRAVRDGVSDIHIEAFRTHSRIRFRIDGVLYEYKSPRIDLHAAIVSRLKVMASLDIAERRLPQDGRIQVHTQGRSVDLRFSSLPGLFGEKVVLRVLDKNQAILDVDKLGMNTGNNLTFKELLGTSFGLILVTGPTGSGKTTTLYAALNHLKTIEKNIVTIEDPVEYQIDIINQNEVKANIGLTFARILKHVLRQDPDIIMVGEIRERETAEIAIQAALTGHLVLSTLHTNDSAGAITRMIDMGIEPYLLSSALIGVVAQRLIRTICPSCKTSSVAPPELVKRYGWEAEANVRLSRGRGCPECYDSGYKGRIGIHETLRTDPDLQQLIISGPSRDDLTAYLEQHDVKSLFTDGLDRVREGKTTIEEVARVIST